MNGMWSAEYWAEKKGVKLYLYRKCAAAPSPGKSAGPILFLVHGSSNSSRSAFDLTIPGKTDYSLMDHFAGLGYDVWTLDHEGYGRSDKTRGNSDISCGADDLAAGLPLVERETGQKKVNLYGASSGALRAALFAQRHPDRVAKLMLSALVYTGEGSPTLIKRREKLAEYRANSHRKIDRAFFHGMFNRDKPGTSEIEAADAMADIELAFYDQIPTGTYLDMCANLPVVDPARVNAPTCIIRGEYDGIATEEDLMKFFALLPSKDKQFVFISGLAHSAALGINRQKFWHAMHAFMGMPASRALAAK
jgi:pimeloyl-ACP methyl ester carboxylesterase